MPRDRITLVPTQKRIRVMAGAATVADSAATLLLLETGHRPVYYFPRADVRMDLMEPTGHHTRCPYKGEASYFSLKADGRAVENAVWSYEQPIEGMEPIAGRLAFYWGKVDRWLEEDEEIFGHPRDPFHRVDVVPSAREVRVVFAGETVARTRRGLFLFETGLPARYYVPQADVRMDLLTPSPTTSLCPYKGRASYWSLRVADRAVPDAAWAYMDPLPECPRIKGHLAFYPEKVDQVEVEGE
ncbi:MAG TPA: DUF427 domain-containing protein [Xanthobacteraceae bacterium]|nr:DUF427 domain-containing protein [Xanthobacteraceae bacterium]